jgi:SAM-dependent methyltransferase
MGDYRLLTDLHKNSKRQGPGGDLETEKAIELAMIDKTKKLKIADIGCGTGASSLILGSLLNADITAVDFLPDFLEILEKRAKEKGVSNKIKTLACSMDNLPFKDDEYDVIWSEGSIYNIGFENGIKAWKPYLKKGGLLVVSEITWLTDLRPKELSKHWEEEYPEIDKASSKIAVLEKNGYCPLGYFVLPEHCWLDNYYRPLQKNFDDFLKLNRNTQEALEIVEAENFEIKLYEKYKDYFSYGVYIARKIA